MKMKTREEVTAMYLAEPWGRLAHEAGSDPWDKAERYTLEQYIEEEVPERE